MTTVKTATMKAVRVHDYGSPEVLRVEDVPRLEAGKGEILIRVHAAGVNPVDTKLREGAYKASLQVGLPFTVGMDFSGVVEDASNGASEFQNGDELFGHLDFGSCGTYAEYVAVRPPDVARKPHSLDHLHAAAVPTAALTAWQSLFDLAGLGVGHTVLIHGAAGGVGSFAVQLAKWKGAKVIGTASAENHDYLWKLGIDEVIDYKKTPFERAVKNVDIVFDTVGGDTQRRSLLVLKQGGVLVSTVGLPAFRDAAALGVQARAVTAKAIARQLRQIGDLIDEGKIRVPLEKVLPLAEAKQAHELTGKGRGKMVLQIVG